MVNIKYMKNLLHLALILITVSCGQDKTNSNIKQDAPTEYSPKPEAIELNNKALEITMLQRDDSIKVDSAILLLDKATALDSLYFFGYSNKIQFLMIKQDFPRMLETNKRIRELRPNQPNWTIQRALILELSGEIEQANTEYKKGINEYERILDSEENLSWEFELEFAQSLVMANNYDKAQKIIKRLKKENPDLEIWKAFELQTKDEILKLMYKKRP